MKSKVIVIANNKGGVAKTTTVSTVGAILAKKGYKVLMIDLDAQANLTESLTPEKKERTTIFEALTDEAELPTEKVKENLYLTPASWQLSALSHLDTHRTTLRLKELIKGVQTKYDFILIDTPPAIGMLTVGGLYAADYIIIPTTAEILPLKGLCTMLDVLATVQKEKALRLLGILLTRFEKSKLCRQVEESLRNSYKEAVFTTKIRKNIAIAEAPVAFKDVESYDTKSNGAKDYTALTEEILQRLKIK